MQSVAFEDFSGGLTDYPLSAGKNKCKVLNNVLLRQYEGGGKPYTRPGSTVLEPQIPVGDKRISTLFIHKGVLFSQSETHLYWYNIGTSAWLEILGPTGNDAFPQSDATSVVTYGFWNYHVLLTHTDYGNAGTLELEYGKPKKLYLDDSGDYQIVEAGLPGVTATPVSPLFVGPAAKRLMKLVFKRQYNTEGDVTFIDYGEPTASIELLTTYPIVVNFVPIANGGAYNYDTANIVVEAYLTESNGTTFYLAASVANSAGTITITTILDANLVLNQQLYTNGGVVANSEPMACRVVHICDEVGYYGAVADGIQQLNYRIMASVPSDIDSVPSTFYTDLDDEVMAISSVKSTVVALGRSNVYRLQNNQDELGQGLLTYEKISDTTSCVSGPSAVQTMFGVFWAGYDGIYYTDGYEVRKLNIEFDKTYKTWTHTDGEIDYEKSSKIKGAYNRAKNTIAWTVGTAGGDYQLYILDLTYGIRQNSAFTTWGGVNFECTSLTYYNGNLYRGDSNGYVFVHSDTTYTDPIVNNLVSPVDWATSEIRYNITTADYDFGTAVTRKYHPLVSVVCEATTNLSLQITANSDSGRVQADLKPIRTRSTIIWGTSGIYWGSPGIYWNSRGGVVHQKRRMPAGSLRSTYMSLSFTNAKVAIISSDVLGLVDVDGGLNTATLTTGGLNFSTSLIAYSIYFSSDGYVTEYPITGVTGNEIEFTGTVASVTGESWVIRGYPRGEVLNLLSATINYEMFGPTQSTYTNSQSGEVGS